MTQDEAPPTPLPPAAQSPYPAHPAPHEHHAAPKETTEDVAPAAGAGLGPLGMTLIGGAVAAVGVAIALPFLKRLRSRSEKPRATRAKKSSTPKKG